MSEFREERADNQPLITREAYREISSPLITALRMKGPSSRVLRARFRAMTFESAMGTMCVGN